MSVASPTLHPQRHAFGGPISRFEALRNYFADAATESEAGALLLYRAASRRDARESIATESSMAKLFCTGAAYRATKNAVQVLGGGGASS